MLQKLLRFNVPYALLLFPCFLVDSTIGYGSETWFFHNPTEKNDWPNFLGPNRDSRSSETGILKDWSDGRLKQVWSVDVGKGYVLGSVSNGLFFQLDAQQGQCRLICRDAKTGIEKWRFEYPFEYRDMYQFDEGPRATPVVDGERVYIYGVEGMLHCLDKSNGNVIWKKNLNQQFGVVQNFFGVGSTPIIHGRYLMVMVGGSPAADQEKSLADVRPNGTAVVIFNKHQGRLLHKIGDDFASYSSLNLYRENQQWYGIAWLRNSVIGFDFENGKVLWSFPFRARKFESVNAATPVIRGTEVLLTESYGPGSVMLNVSGGDVQIKWKDENIRQRSIASHWNTPVFHDGYVYGCHGENRAGAEVRCVEWKTGKVMWKQRGFARSSMTYIDGHLVLLDEMGKLALIKADPEAFQLVTQYSDAKGDGLPIQYPCWAAPLISDGLLYIRGRQKIFCLQLK